MERLISYMYHIGNFVLNNYYNTKSKIFFIETIKDNNNSKYILC